MPANIVVPEVGESIVDARIAKWLRKEGDAVSAGDPLVELETDKIDLEVSAPQAGVLSRIDRKDGEDVKVGEVLGVIDETKASAGEAASSAPAPQAGTAKPASPAPTLSPTSAQVRSLRATPTAKKAAEQHDVDLTRVKGSGDAGRVMRRDVEQAATTGTGNGKAAQAPVAEPRKPRPSGPVEMRRSAERGE
jgi:2-oxoglutarate dehydrogenase E2 component (dihydrolipoamide succinyltransferase)